MTPNTIKLATLNLHRFEDWETRLPAVVALLKLVDADIIFLQEVQRDTSRDGRNQAEIINGYLGYGEVFFEIACIKTTRKGIPLSNPVEHGLAIISKIPIKVERIVLTQAEGDVEPRILMVATVKNTDAAVELVNIHFANKDEWADAHFKEAISIFRERAVKPIIAGDFNIKDIKKHASLYGEEYVCSGDVFEYLSYPTDGLSYDHILVPREFTLENFECRNEIVSDHRLLLAEIDLNKKSDQT